MVNFLVRMKGPQTPRKSPEKWTFLSLAFYNAPSLDAVESTWKKDVNVIGNFVFEFNLITFTSRVHLISFRI